MENSHDDDTPDPSANQSGGLPAAVPEWASIGDEAAATPAPLAQEPRPRGRWSGRTTAVVVAAAIGIGGLGAVGAATAVAQSDDRGSGDVRGGPGGFGRPGQGSGMSGRGTAPGGRLQGEGGPGLLPPGGFGGGDRHGPDDGHHDGGGSGTAPGGAPQLPGGGSRLPGGGTGADSTAATGTTTT